MAVAAITTNVATAAKAEIHSAFTRRRCLKLVQEPARPEEAQNQMKARRFGAGWRFAKIVLYAHLVCGHMRLAHSRTSDGP